MQDETGKGGKLCSHPILLQDQKKKKMHEVEQDGKILPILIFIYIYIFDNFLIRKERI